ncbi:MAG: thymidylate synthase ThyX, partial [Patescibacteria group bacterium]
MVKEGRTLADLQHSHVETPRGANIYVIDTGAVIDAEATAMLQALHSRSTGGLQHHLEELASRGADNFMKNFYVGYGHKSIGDCGTTTMFIEDVSMLAAKAIQDFPLYNGQEASTRYIDFSKQHFIDPTNSNNGFNIKESQRDFYMKLQDPVRAALKEEFPMQDGEKESIYDKAINARGFDITRGFLPAGATTNLAWHSNLRQVSDRLLFLRHHPLAEVREIAEGIGEAVKEMHPNSFSDKRYEASEAYQDEIAAEYYYHNPQAKGLTLENNISLSGIEDNRRLLEARPEKTELPKYLGQLGNIQAQFTLDYGSFRDIQRHRAINQRMPLLTTELGV